MHRKVQPPTKTYTFILLCIVGQRQSIGVRCALYAYLHSTPFRLLMMQHNSCVSSSSIITVMPHDCMAFSIISFVISWTTVQSSVDCLQLRVRHIDQTQSSNTHIHVYITAAQVKHNGDRSPEVPRDADPVVYTLRCISKSSLDGGGDSFLYRLFLDSFLVMPVFAIGHGCSTTNSRNTQ